MKTLPLILTFACLSASACHRVSLYELPPPPPVEERKSVSLIPGEEKRDDEARYLEVRAATLELFNLLSTKRYEEATQRLSAETLDFLRTIGGKKNPADVLVAGELHRPDGSKVAFDPVVMLVAEDVSKLSDSVDGLEEHETNERKEIFATLPSGQLQKIVLITERGKWVLHRTRIPEPFDPPK